jgi:two-component sensor histidine kinase
MPDLVDDVALIVTELVTNACKHAGNAFPAGALTMWHPNKWLIITVHDKSPYIPYRETYRGGVSPDTFAWGINDADAMDADDEARRSTNPMDWSATSGRGLQLVRALAADHCGELDWVRDGDTTTPGKVARVKMLLPNVQWPHSFRDPWTGRTVMGRPRDRLQDASPWERAARQA